MARTAARGQADREEGGSGADPPVLSRLRTSALRYRYGNQRTAVTLGGLVRLRRRIRRCETLGWHHRRPCRPEGEGSLVLPQHELGLDTIVLIGALRDREHKSVPEMHGILRERGVVGGRGADGHQPARPLR